MSERHPKLLLEDILDSAGKILSYTNDLSFKEFTEDGKTVDAIMRNYEIIGEAANRLPQSFKDEAASIDWFRIRVLGIELCIIILVLITKLYGN
jgi:uncharacterized protein with HEPN domain